MKIYRHFIISIVGAFCSTLAHASCGTMHGVDLPCYTDYLDANEGPESLPNYPYAKSPNGCSIPEYKPGEWDAWRLTYKGFGFNISFRKACIKHDTCYYTPGTSPNQCNTQFHHDLNVACDGGLSGFDGILVGILTGAYATCKGKGGDYVRFCEDDGSNSVFGFSTTRSRLFGSREGISIFNYTASKQYNRKSAYFARIAVVINFKTPSPIALYSGFNLLKKDCAATRLAI